MASSLNKVILIGRLGKDPETKFTQGGVAISKFSIATDEEWKDRNGEKQKKTEWHNIVAWRRLAEICNQFLIKGKQVYVEGRLETKKWSDKDGNDRWTTQIAADKMIMLGGEGKKEEKKVVVDEDLDAAFI